MASTADFLDFMRDVYPGNGMPKDGKQHFPTAQSANATADSRMSNGEDKAKSGKSKDRKAIGAIRLFRLPP